MAIRFQQHQQQLPPFSYVGFVFNCIPGIGIAGLVYPVLVAVYLLFRVAIPNWFRYGGLSADVFFEIVFFVVAPLLISSMLGFMVAIFSSWMSGLLISAVNTTLGYPLRPKVFISCVGGLAGYSTLALLFLVPGVFFSLGDAIEAFVIGPGLGALVGQTGARWWARKRVLFPRQEQQQLPATQFRIAHVLALTAWLAATLAILRLATNSNLPLLVSAYFPVQLICLGMGCLADRYVDWKTGIRYVG